MERKPLTLNLTTPMEIEITQLLEADAFAFSHSIAEGGQNAGPNTWRAAIEETKSSPLLSTPEQVQAVRDYLNCFGAWTVEEIAAWPDNEVNALFLQMIAGDIREMSFDSLSELTPDDWEEYEADESLSHRIFRADDGRIFYYVGI